MVSHVGPPPHTPHKEYLTPLLRTDDCHLANFRDIYYHVYANRTQAKKIINFARFSGKGRYALH